MSFFLLLKLIVLFLLGLILSVVVRTRKAFIPLGGIETLALGWVIGPSVLGILNFSDYRTISFIFVLSATFFGFIHGFQWEGGYVRKIPRKFLIVHGGLSSFLFILGYWCGRILYPYVYTQDMISMLTHERFAAVIGFMSAVTAPTLVVTLYKRKFIHLHESRLLVLMSVIQTSVALMLYVFTYISTREAFTREIELWALALILLAGAGWTLHAWGVEIEERVTLFIGFLFLLSGVSVLFPITMVGTGLFVGILCAQSPFLKRILSGQLQGFEKALYFVFSVLLGGLIHTIDTNIILIAGFILIFRTVTKIGIAHFPAFRPKHLTANEVGMVWLSISGMTLVVITEAVWYEYGPDPARWLPSWAVGLIIGVVLCDLLASYWWFFHRKEQES